MPEPDPEDAQLSERERAHLSHRERKRETRMVVDNAGVKRVQQAVSRRGAAKRRRSKPRTD
jgi:hypothetical protein